ncbi:unnamed protein product, partial [Polarella glacialis]
VNRILACLKEDDVKSKEDAKAAGSPDEFIPDPTQFHLFEQCFHQAQEKLTTMRREREQILIEEHALTEEQIVEFRSDLVALHLLFQKFDKDKSKTLDADEVLALVEASGVNTNNMAKESLYEMIRGCKLLASAAREEASGGARKRCTGILEGMSTSPRRDAQGILE